MTSQKHAPKRADLDEEGIPLSIRIRTILRLTQVDLAKILGVHPITVGRWEAAPTSKTSLAPHPWQIEVMQIALQGLRQQRKRLGKLYEALNNNDPMRALFVILASKYQPGPKKPPESQEPQEPTTEVQS